jgi:hypothetical protein
VNFALGFLVGATTATVAPIGGALLAARLHEWNLARQR